MPKNAIPTNTRKAPHRNKVPIVIVQGLERRAKAARITPQELERVNRYALIVKMRLAGYTPVEIAERTGMNPASVGRILQAMMSQTKEELGIDANQLRTLNTLRLEQAILRINEYVENGQERIVNTIGGPILITEPPDVLAAAVCLAKVIKGQAELNGLNAPKEVQISDIRREYVGVDMDEV